MDHLAGWSDLFESALIYSYRYSDPSTYFLPIYTISDRHCCNVRCACREVSQSPAHHACNASVNNPGNLADHGIQPLAVGKRRVSVRKASVPLAMASVC